MSRNHQANRIRTEKLQTIVNYDESPKTKLKILQKNAEVLQNKIPVSKSIGPGPAAYDAKFEA